MLVILSCILHIISRCAACPLASSPNNLRFLLWTVGLWLWSLYKPSLLPSQGDVSHPACSLHESFLCHPSLNSNLYPCCITSSVWVIWNWHGGLYLADISTPCAYLLDGKAINAKSCTHTVYLKADYHSSCEKLWPVRIGVCSVVSSLHRQVFLAIAARCLLMGECWVCIMYNIPEQTPHNSKQ